MGQGYTCADCGGSFEKTGLRGPLPVRCPACAKARAKAIGIAARPKYRARFNAQQNAKKRALAAARPPREPRQIQCVDCPTVFEWNKAGRPSLRCLECRIRVGGQGYANALRWREENPEKWAELSRAAFHRRRARKTGADAEHFTGKEIFERDGYICHLCGELCEGQWPAPFSPSQDHVIPISKGGPHTRANVKTAHLRCNMSKRDRVPA